MIRCEQGMCNVSPNETLFCSITVIILAAVFVASNEARMIKVVPDDKASERYVQSFLPRRTFMQELAQLYNQNLIFALP